MTTGTYEVDVAELLKKPNAQLVRQLLAVQRGDADSIELTLENGDVVQIEAVPMVRVDGRLVEDPRMQEAGTK